MWGDHKNQIPVVRARRASSVAMSVLSSSDDEIPLAQRASVPAPSARAPSTHAQVTTNVNPNHNRSVENKSQIERPVAAPAPPAAKPTAEDGSSDDDDVPLAQRGVKTEGVNVSGHAAKPPAVTQAAKPPTVTPKPMLGGGFKMSKRPVTLPAKPSSRLDSSSDEVDSRSLAVRREGLERERREREEEERRRKALKRAKMEKIHARALELEKLEKAAKKAKLKAKRAKMERSDRPKTEVKRPKINRSEGYVKKGAVIMWKTLEHNGVVFPPPYEPHGVPLTYDGQDVKLLPHEEEIAGFFAVMKDTDYAQKAVFVKNFMDGFKEALANGPHAFITDFRKCDFTKMYNHFAKIREEKKQMTSEEKKRIKAEKDKAEEMYTWATIDGRREKVGNFRIEPPGLFRGRGEHPKMGKIKRRVMPEDITINIGKDARVPPPPPGHSWKAVIHNDTATWLAGWNDVINVKDWKYVQFGATSTVKAESDQKKYEKARSLHKFIEKIRADYKRNMQSESREMAQLAVTTYLVDKLALRAGGEKDEDLADTVGVCTLRAGHIKFMEDNVIEFDFLGKDSIQYLQQHKIDEVAYKCLQRFVKDKGPDVDIFDLIDPSKVNAHLQTLMPGLTIKVFRTYNASITLDSLLADTDTNLTTLQKKAKYDAANKEVAILCNHQKGVSKAHDEQMGKLNDKKKDLAKQITDMKKNKDDKNQKKKLTALKERAAKLAIQMEMKEELKTVSLGTSKINYLDPRITLSWCKRHEVPPPTVFTKALIDKFHWAMDCDMDFKFTEPKATDARPSSGGGGGNDDDDDE